MYIFGSGYMYGIPTADATGTAVTNPTPQRFGVLQDVSVDFAFENKMLHGQNQFPVAVGRGKGKVGIKAKHGVINGALFNSMFFGQTMSNDVVSAKNQTVGKAIPATPFTLTASAASESAVLFLMPGVTPVFSRDLGVIGPTGLAWTRVAAAPGVSQYTVSAGGAYVFNTADAGLLVYISYEYTSTLAAAKQFSVINQAMGYAPQFMLVLNNQYSGGYMHMRFPACISAKLSMASKNDDFAIPEIDIDAFADSGGNVALIGFSE